MTEIQKIVDQMEPSKALDELTAVTRKLLSHLDEQARVQFVADLIGESGADKIASMVNL